jgi:alpha-galactosidase
MRKFLVSLATLVLVAAGLLGIQLHAATPAAALDNGLALTPPMGFNDWNAFGCNVSEQLIEQTADAMAANGMKAAGYQYVNIDDCWALPQRDANGNLVPDPAKFPHGITAVADYVHAKGLKLGIYEDSGTKTCSSSHGFPGSLGHEDQDALQFAQWGVDYLKYDDCNQPADQQNATATIQRYQTMRDALAKATQQTGHPIVFSICEKTDFGVPNSAWPPVGNLWRTTGDIKDQYSRMVSIFHSNVQLASLAKPGAWNDPDMLEIGNGGQSDTEYRSEFSLWSEMAAPLIAGTDLRKASPATLAIYTNSDVIAVDQDPLGKQGTVVSSDNGHWVLTKPLANGDVAVALFNETDTPATISTTASQAGLGKANAYTVRDLWQHTSTESAGNLTAVVAPHATMMYRVSAGADPGTLPPHTALGMTGLDSAQPGHPATITATFANDGRIPAENLQLSLGAPAGWTVQPTSATSFPSVPGGRTVNATWQVTEPQPSTPFPSGTLTTGASYMWGPDSTAASDSAAQTVTPATPVQPPYHTFSSTSPAATFSQAGGTLGIRAAGADVYGGTNQYGAIYLPNAEQDGTTDTVELTGQGNTSDQAKAGIMVRNDIAQSGTSPGFVILAATPGHGYVLQWDGNGDGNLDSSSAPSGQGTGTTAYPSWLKLTRNGTAFTGYYSTDGTTWNEIGSADVPSAAAAQDAGVFSTAHSSAVGESDFAHLNVGPPSGLIDAPRTTVTLPGQAAQVAATFYDHGSAPVSNAAVTLTAPAGWTVTPTGPTALGTVAPGGSAGASWQVTAPNGTAAGPYPVRIVATYDDGGQSTQSSATVNAVVPSTDLSSAYDNVGITDDSNTTPGNIDGAGSSLSAQALAAVGVTPGSAITHNGMQFAWPDVPSGKADNVLASGQSFQLSGSGPNLGFLATATYGPATGTGSITYADGTTQQFTLSVPDWYSSPPSGSDSAITMSYRNRSGNTQQVHPVNVFLVKVPLQSGKTPSGVTLPNVSSAATSGTPAMHIFGIAIGN